MENTRYVSITFFTHLLQYLYIIQLPVTSYFVLIKKKDNKSKVSISLFETDSRKMYLSILFYYIKMPKMNKEIHVHVQKTQI